MDVADGGNLRYESYSHQDLVGFFQHQLKIIDRKRLLSINFSERWVNVASLVCAKWGNIEVFLSPLVHNGAVSCYPLPWLCCTLCDSLVNSVASYLFTAVFLFMIHVVILNLPSLFCPTFFISAEFHFSIPSFIISLPAPLGSVLLDSLCREYTATTLILRGGRVLLASVFF